jgi:hypothetical protein
VHDLGDLGAEAVAVRSFGDRSGSDRPAGDLRLPRATAPRNPRPDRPWRSAGRTADPGADTRPCARSAWSRKPARRPRRPPRSRRSVGAQGGDGLVPVRVEKRLHALRELRLGPFDIPPLRHTPMITSLCQHGPGFGSCPPRLFNPREQHARPRAIGSQSVRLSANSARPARRSTDGRTILDALPAAQEPGPDLRFRGAPLRNRTVDLLLTMDIRQVSDQYDADPHAV